MALPAPKARPTLPVSAKLAVGLLAVIGAVTVVRWVLNGVFTLLVLAAAAFLLAMGAKAVTRRLPS